MVRGGRLVWSGLQRYFFRNEFREDPPGKPRKPRARQRLTAFHVSPGILTTGPVFAWGHFPVRLWCASAHLRICSSVRSFTLRPSITPLNAQSLNLQKRIGIPPTRLAHQPRYADESTFSESVPPQAS